MATFRKRAGKWQARIQRKGYPDQTKTFMSKSDAIAWARQIESEFDRGVLVNRSEADKTTLQELFQRYLEEMTPNKKGAANEAYRVKAWIKEPIASRFLSGIRSADFAAWRDSRLKQGVSANTVRLVGIWNHARDLDEGRDLRVSHNPISPTGQRGDCEREWNVE